MPLFHKELIETQGMNNKSQDRKEILFVASTKRSKWRLTATLFFFLAYALDFPSLLL